MTTEHPSQSPPGLELHPILMDMHIHNYVNLHVHQYYIITYIIDIICILLKLWLDQFVHTYCINRVLQLMSVIC